MKAKDERTAENIKFDLPSDSLLIAIKDIFPIRHIIDSKTEWWKGSAALLPFFCGMEVLQLPMISDTIKFDFDWSDKK